MTIGRRQVFGLSALGLGAIALEGCGTGPMPRLGHGAKMGPEDVERLLTELDKVVLHLESLDADPKTFGIQGHGARVARGRQQCIELLITLCFLGTYRDVPETVWKEPRVAAHLARSLPRIQAVIVEARGHLTGMSDETVAAIDERLERDPDLPMKIMERIDGYAKHIDVPMEQRTYLRLSTVQLAARFRYEGTREVTRKLSSNYSRILDSKIADLGLEDLATSPSIERMQTPRSNLVAGAFAKKPRGEPGESCVTDADCEAGLACAVGECAPTPKSSALQKSAKQVAIVGLWLLIPPACAIGVLVLLEALFLVIVSGLVSEEG
jgi:hypothetical protein